MQTIHDVRKANKFLSNAQEWALIDALTYNTKRPRRIAVANAIRYHFLSLEYRDYWKDFEVTAHGVAYTGSNISEVRKDILSQVED